MSRKTRKLMWSMPLIAAVAVIGVLALLLTLEPNEASAQDNTKPGRPMNLTATADGPTIIKLDWDAAEGGGGATGYRIDISADGVKWEEFVTNTGNSTTQYLHRGLLSQAMHYYRVFGVNSIDTGLVSATVVGRTEKSDAPDAPENLEAEAKDGNDPATSAADFFIDLTWTAPIDPVGAPVDAYKIEVSDDGRRWRDFAVDEKLESGSTQMYSADVKYGGETRYYRVTAMNTLSPDGEVGSSDASNTGFDTTVNGPVPMNVDELRAGVQPTSLDTWLYWDWNDPKMTPPLGTIPDDFRAVVQTTRVGRVITQAEVDADADDDIDAPVALSALLSTTTIANDATWTNVEEISWSLDYEAAAAQMRAMDLKPAANEVWAFRVLPKNKFGTAAVDDTDTPVVRAVLGSDTAPDNVDLRTVHNDDAENDGRSGLQLTWRSTSNNTDDPAFVTIAEAGADDDLDAHNDYAVQYRIEVSDDGEHWAQLVVVEDDVSELNDTPAGSDTVDFEDNGNVAPVDSPEAAGGDANTEDDFDANAQMFTDRELAAGTTKHYRMFAFVRSNPESDTSPMIMGVPSRERDGDTAGPLLPGTPRDLEARATGRTTIEVTWNYPETTDDGCDQLTGGDNDGDNTREDDGSECGDSVIMHYQVQVSDSSPGPWTDLAEDVCLVLDKDGKATKEMEDPCTYTHKGMMPDTTKHYRVYAVNAAGDGPVSNTDVDTTKLSEFPDVPGGFVGEAYGATAAKLCWLAQSLDPADDPVHAYQITVSGMDDPVMVTANADGVVPTQTAIMGLSPDTEYTFMVRAVNNRGATNESATEMVTTGMAMPEPPSTELTRPTMVSAMGGAGTVTVSWEDGENAVGHLVILLDSEFNVAEVDDSPTGNQTVFSGLSAGTYYGVVVAFKSASDYEYAYDAATAN